jgi:catechol 2,3-dioxygenase-like lactoylglutathione lyase family enzyme
MAYHHTAFATKDLEATHRFYSEAMGFELAKVVTGANPEGGWAKHVFYETGNEEYIAFWELHDLPTPKPWSPAISTGMGLPAWVNHLAFKASDLADLDARKQRWLDHGYPVLRVDHGFCVSIYTDDPNGILVEFCTTTEPLGEADKEEALRLLRDPHPPLDAGKGAAEFFEPPKA